VADRPRLLVSPLINESPESMLATEIVVEHNR
jgi:hypothetical protein